jgi:hypothetical protein
VVVFDKGAGEKRPEGQVRPRDAGRSADLARGGRSRRSFTFVAAPRSGSTITLALRRRRSRALSSDRSSSQHPLGLEQRPRDSAAKPQPPGGSAP